MNWFSYYNVVDNVNKRCHRGRSKHLYRENPINYMKN